MKKIYKVKISNFLKISLPYIIGLLLLGGIMIYGGYMNSGVGISIDYMLFCGIFIFFIGGYPFIVHLNHYLHDKNTEMVIDTEANMFYYKNGDVVKNMQISDIWRLEESIFIGKGYNLRYYELSFKDNTKLIITPVLVSDLEELGELLHVPLRQKRTLNMFNMIL